MLSCSRRPLQICLFPACIASAHVLVLLRAIVLPWLVPLVVDANTTLQGCLPMMGYYTSSRRMCDGWGHRAAKVVKGYQVGTVFQQRT